MKVKFISKTEENHNFLYDVDMKKIIELPWFLESIIDKDRFRTNLLFQILKNNVRNFKKDECKITYCGIGNVIQCKITYCGIGNVIQCEIMNKNFTYFGINIYPEDITRDFICDIESILTDNRVTFSEVVIEGNKVGFKNMHYIALLSS